MLTACIRQGWRVSKDGGGHGRPEEGGAGQVRRRSPDQDHRPCKRPRRARASELWRRWNISSGPNQSGRESEGLMGQRTQQAEPEKGTASARPRPGASPGRIGDAGSEGSKAWAETKSLWDESRAVPSHPQPQWEWRPSASSRGIAGGLPPCPHGGGLPNPFLVFVSSGLSE